MSALLSRRVSDLELESSNHKKRLDAHDKIFKSFEGKFDIIKRSLETLLNRIPIKKKITLSWKNLTPWNVGVILMLLVIGLGAMAANG